MKYTLHRAAFAALLLVRLPIISLAPCVAVPHRLAARAPERRLGPQAIVAAGVEINVEVVGKHSRGLVEVVPDGVRVDGRHVRLPCLKISQELRGRVACAVSNGAVVRAVGRVP